MNNKPVPLIERWLEDDMDSVFVEKPIETDSLPSEFGGPGSGNHGHEGRPGKVGGSAPSGTSPVTKGIPNSRYSAYAAKFNGMHETGTAKSSKNKKWIKEHQSDYDNDKQFKAVADYATLYSQGSYSYMRAIAQHKMTGEWPEGSGYEDSNIPKWAKEDLSAVSHPLAVYKNYFEGQDVESELGISTEDAAMVVEKTIANAPELEYSVYRGVTGTHYMSQRPTEANDYAAKYDKWPPMPKVGDEIDFVGATSFSADADLARQFSENRAKGQRNKGLGPGAWATFVYEIENAKGIEISALSPWSQSEVLTSGRYEVISVAEDSDPSFKKLRRGYSTSVPHYHVKLRQVGTWKID